VTEVGRKSEWTMGMANATLLCPRGNAGVFIDTRHRERGEGFVSRVKGQKEARGEGGCKV